MADHKFTLLMEPVTFYRNDEGRPVLVQGHHRLQTLRLLARQRQHSFDPEMPIPAVEVPRPGLEESKGDDEGEE